MTSWFVNDLSLSGQYENAKEFCVSLDKLISVRESNEMIRGRLFCSLDLGSRPVMGTMALRDVVLKHADHSLRHRALLWIAKDGPFWAGERAEIDDDLFWFEGVDITNQGLGEAARKGLLGLDTNSFSFPGSQPSCDGSPLTVVQGLLQAPIAKIDVANTCDPDSIARSAVRALGMPRNWHAAFEALRAQFHRITFSADLERSVEGQPFVRYVYERSCELIGVLDQLLLSRDRTGQWTDKGKYLIANHFQRKKAWFTDESDANKRDFKSELTFADPGDQTSNIFCPWHGKIKTPQYRIHFQWPIEPDQKTIKVVYIGPKITKK